MLQLPPLDQPQRYAGLFVYDFGDHTAVGYTAAEIAVLRFSTHHRHGKAYEIYRVDDSGSIELRGVSDAALVARDGLAFLRHTLSEARADYDILVSLAERWPCPVSAELTLARVYMFEPDYAVVLTYPATASSIFARWLDDAHYRGGSTVLAGPQVIRETGGANLIRLASTALRAKTGYSDRSAEEVLRSVDRPVQR